MERQGATLLPAPIPERMVPVYQVSRVYARIISDQRLNMTDRVRISQLPDKTIPVDADHAIITDSEATNADGSYVTKRTTIGGIRHGRAQPSNETPQRDGATGDAGTSEDYARGDHRHQGGGGGGDDAATWAESGNTDIIPSDKLPARTGAFTAEDETKLDGVEAGAQVNPDNIVSFRTEDGSNANVAGLTFFIKSDNTQWQSGLASDNVVSIEINANQYTLSQNPQTDTGSYTGWHSLPQNMVDHKGSTIWNFHYGGSGVNFPNDPSLIIQAETIVKNNDGNYVLQTLTILEDYSITGSGHNWQVAGVFAPPSGADAIVGQIAKNILPSDVVYAEELEGRETDRYASYNNAFVGNAYRSGDFVLTTDTSGPPTSGNQVGQPDIVTGSGLIALGRLRTDRDPNNLQWAPVPSGSEYANGDVLHVTIWDDPNHGHLRVTLTSDLTLVGTGDAAYVWATASWVEVGDVADVQQVGDYFKIAEYQPSDLDLRIPAGDIIDPPWVETDGSNVTDALIDRIQGDNETVDLTNTWRVDTTNVDYYVALNESGVLNIGTFRLPSSAVGSADDLALTRLIKDRNWVDIGGYTIDVTTNATRSVIGTSLTFVFNYEVVSGSKPTGSTPVHAAVYGEDTHRGELARAAFRNENPSIDGTGGSGDNVWARVSGIGRWATLTSLAVALRQALESLTGDSRIAASAIKPATWTHYTSLLSEQAPDQWTTILTSVDADDMIDMRLVYEAGDGNWGTVGAGGRFGAYPANTKVWLPRPADSGARINVRRSGTSLQAQTAGPLTGQTYELSVRNLGH